MPKKKLKPNNDGKRMPLNATGTNRPMDGGGSRGTSKDRLMPNNSGKKLSVAPVGGRPMKGKTGPKRT